MKYAFLLLILIGHLYSCQSQITFEHSLPEQNSPLTSFVTEKGIQFYSLFSNEHTLVIYNTDYSIYKTIDLPSATLDGYPSIAYMSDKLFDLDSELEFFITTANGTDMYAWLMDDNGNTIQEFKNRSPLIITNLDKTSKLQMRAMRYDKASPTQVYYQDDVYSLPGKYKY